MRHLSTQLEQFQVIVFDFGDFISHRRQPVRRVVTLALPLLDLFGQWRLLLLERLILFAQLRGLAGFVNSRASENGERGSDESFLE